ncbi:MAG: type VI secretion system protein TssA [Sedimentisphaerales bacterium]|nr:type VI secretion system protein TssA [Sedimentisphaerales bacterium]
MAVDVESLLAEVSEDAPCGGDLSYDSSFLALEDLLRAKPADSIVEGVDEAAEEPNWREVRDKSIDLLRQSKDLRVAVYLTLALLRTEGIGGLSDGLSLLRGLLERFWDHLHPQLDPEDNHDPLQRINILQSLSPGGVSEQDAMRFTQRLAEVPLCNSARMGKFSLRDIRVAKGELALDGEGLAEAPDTGVIDAAFQDTATEELLATAQAVERALEHATALRTTFAQRAVQNQSPNLSDLEGVLGHINKCLQEHLAKRGYGQAISEGAPTGGETEAAAPPSGEIRSANDALLAMEKVCQYFERHEPSSPVPLLLRRAQKLVSKNFLEVIEDVCPDAANQVKMIGGIGDSDNR